MNPVIVAVGFIILLLGIAGAVWGGYNGNIMIAAAGVVAFVIGSLVAAYGKGAE